MPDALQMLLQSHDGPVSREALATARWGAGAWRQLVAGADAALLEARLRACVAALARLRRSNGADPCDTLKRHAGGVAAYRRMAVRTAP